MFCSTVAGQFDIQWCEDRRCIIYDYHRYVKCQRQPRSTRKQEQQFTCYVKECLHTIRVRKTDKGRWVVSKFVMHDMHKRQIHASCRHTHHAPATCLVENITTVAQQDAILSGQSARKAIERQMLQNPSLNKLKSVAGLFETAL